MTLAWTRRHSWLALTLWAALPDPARSEEIRPLSELSLYDTFTKGFIDPAKWKGGWQCGDGIRECVKEVQLGRLHLRARGYGAIDTNEGGQYGVSELGLKNVAVTDLAARLVVRRIDAGSCATGLSVAWAGLTGAFFNDGEGTAFGDVQATVQLSHESDFDPPGVMHVGLFLGSRYQTWPGSAYLGQVNVGEAVVLRLTWDQPGHRFVARLFKPASGTLVEGQLSYSVSDAIPAVTPYRKLVAALSTPNCVSGQTFAEVDAVYDNVLTN
jgi:hypothetical protein